jgi:lincosamide nucleotidyltransferase A/C/D/E
LASRVATYLPLAGLWKSEVMELAAVVGVPVEVLASSRRADPECGRPQEMADIPFETVDGFLQVRVGEWPESDLAGLPAAAIAYLDSVYRRNGFKAGLPLRGPQPARGAAEPEREPESGKSRMLMKAEMTATALVELLHLFESAALPVWLDGGWGVDALLQTQTRPSKDVDLVLAVADVPRLCELLAVRGFAVREGQPPHSFVLADGAGLEVDVHAVTFDGAGNGVYRMQSGAEWVYPAEGFNGRGLVAGVAVRCLSPAAQVLGYAHGYVPVEKDFRDMERLAERFGAELPPQLRRGRPEGGLS